MSLQHIELLPENWAHVRAYWALLILWDQWRVMLSDASKQSKYIDRSQCAVNENLDRYSGVFVGALTGVQWYGNRIGALTGADALIHVRGQVFTLERIKVLFMFSGEDADYRKWRGKRWREAIADDTQVTLVGITPRVITWHRII